MLVGGREMTSNGFSYDENAGYENKEVFGVEWLFKQFYIDTANGHFEYYHIRNKDFGEFHISSGALNRIEKTEYHKVLSLIYEQYLKKEGNIFSITLVQEKELLQWTYDNYISLSLDEFINRFPSDFIELQQRALINLYRQYPEYGQAIKNINNTYTFFTKNESELCFIIESIMGLKDSL
jgi:hypothetical protein